MSKISKKLGRLLLCFSFGLVLAAFWVFHSSAPRLSLFQPRLIPLYGESLTGRFDYPISTHRPGAQAYFNQGFQLRYGFAKPEAVRSFQAAAQQDPTCAMCRWGEAWALGGYLNEPMTAADALLAYAAAEKALALSSTGTAKEQDLIHAIALRYSPTWEPDTQAERDAAYAKAMEQVAQRYPNDLDIKTLYGEALFLLEPRRGQRDLADPKVQKLLSVFETVLEQDIRHGGACHLYIHATEATAEPGRAEPCSAYISDAIPGVSHINHMPSHTWNEVGRWGDSVQANQQALKTDAQASQGKGLAVYHGHNLQMLLYAASMDGQSAIALQTAQDYAAQSGDISFQLLTWLRFGRFDEILSFTQRPKAEMAGGLWDFAQGYSQLRRGQVESARQLLTQLQTEAASAQSVFRRSSVQDLLMIAAGILEGEIKQQAGDSAGAIAAQTQAVSIEDQLIYDEPEQLPFSARHWLGANLLAAEQYAAAEQVYRDELNDHPHNGWSLIGLKSALDAQGKPFGEVAQDFRDRWARADVSIQASRF